MAFSKYANAAIVQPIVTMASWDQVRSTSLAIGSAFSQREARQDLSQKYDPKQYMLSHCTIMASVDTENGPGPVGRHVEGAFQVDRRFHDYYITPATSKFINNNHDSWERKLLLSTFRTFIGGQNYVEHLQIAEMSKGRIIDAAARDIGESIYIDILVATELRHKPLVAAIQSKKLNTLSMGCSVEFTVCSRCGNAAEDETQLCSHIRYMKGNTFMDGLGKTRKVAELCGHSTNPNSVKFIEASWVANPAFTGAVLRDILTPTEVQTIGPRLQMAFSMPVQQVDPTLMARAARVSGYSKPSQIYGDDKVVRSVGTPHHYRTLLGQDKVDPDFGADLESDQDQGQTQQTPDIATPALESKPDSLQKGIDDLADILKEKAMDKVRGEISKRELEPRADFSENQNNTLVHQASANPYWKEILRVVQAKVQDPSRSRRIFAGLILFKNGGWHAVRAANSFSGREVLGISRFLDEFQGSRIAGEARIYRAILAVGGFSPYTDVDGYLAACRRFFGRDLTNSERDTLISKGHIYDLGVSRFSL